jgi:tetratricopeptide (TPR) repeat protein
MRRRGLALGGIAAAALFATGGVWLLRSSGPRGERVDYPPSVELSGADPDAVAAVRAATERVRASPERAAAWGELGMVLLAHELPVPAAACLEQAELRDASDPRWPYLRGLALLKGSPSLPEAIACLERAASFRAAPPAVRLKLAEALLEAGRTAGAEAHLRAVLASQPRDARALAGLGRLAVGRGELAPALEHLRASAAAAPNVKATRTLLAEVLHRLGQGAAAEAERRAIAALPDAYRWPDPYWQQVTDRWTGAMAAIERASDRAQGGRGAEAIALLRDAAARYPSAILVHLTLGRFLLESGQAGEAEAALRRACEVDQRSFEAHHELGVALGSQGKLAEAAAEFQRALAIAPEFPPSHFQLAQCRLRAGDAHGAIASLRAAVRYRPSYAQAHRELGRLLLAGGDRGGAATHLRSALELNPTDEEARKLLDAAAR